MGAKKKIDVYRSSLTDEDLAEEDAASRSRLEGYRSMKPSIAREAAIDSEQEWREEIGLPVVDPS